jgi:ketosteroid isomerase-like protein
MPTEHPHVTITKALWAAVAEGDPELVRDYLADEVVWQVQGTHLHSGEFRGPDQVLDYLARLGEAADDLVSDLESIYWNDLGTVVWYRVSARREPKRLELDFLLQLWIEDGLVTRGRVVPTDQHRNDLFWS